MNRMDGRGARRGVAVAALVVLVPGALAAQATAPDSAVRSFTLEQAVAAALENSPAIVQGEGAVRTADASRRSAWGAFLPNLSLSSGASRASTTRLNPQTNTTVTGSSGSYTAGLSGSLDLFTGGRRAAELGRSRAVSAAADASLVDQRFQVSLDTRTAFYDVLRAGELIRVAESQVKRAQEQLQAAEQRMKVGSATKSDVLRAQLTLTQSRQSLAQADVQRRNGQFSLGRLVGIDGRADAQPPASLEPKPLAVSDADLPALVEAQSPRVSAAAASVKSGEASVKVARAQYLPSLRLTSGYDWLNQDFGLDGGRASWNMRLGLSYPIFNGFQREQQVETAAVQADVARAQLDDARRGARADLERALAALHLAEQQIDLSKQAVQVAAEDLRVQQERYRLGASTILDQITSQTSLVQAQTDLVNATYDYQIARAQLEALVGREL